VKVEWTRVPRACAHELFEQHVGRDPGALAVICGEQRLTYGELNARANQVARRLRAYGVGTETLVGVALERCPELVVALLGVWKAGGAYVPLDPSYPRERLSFMAQDAQLRVVLTNARHRAAVAPLGARLLRLDADWRELAQERDDDLRLPVDPEHLAYVMYTSGSTGRPKGAMILHGGLVNYLWWAIAAYGVDPGGSVPVHSSISFDLTVTSLYPALLAGGVVELLPDDDVAQSLLAALRRAPGRTLVKITPAHLQLLTHEVAASEAAGLARTFVIGGENLPAETLRFWRKHAPATRLINEYGPTETVVGCCTYEVRPDDPDHGAVPIGWPIANTQLYVLNERREPVAPGEKGELYIGGAGVARGYLNRADLTAACFLPDPCAGIDGATMYRTGDLARRRADRALEFLGRVDHQVKIRGHRVELGEIETTLAAHHAVEAGVVVARGDAAQPRHLVAYLVAADGEHPSTDMVHAFLGERLPDYMLPSDVVWLERLPLTGNGKVDREALPAPAPRRRPGVDATRTATEAAVAEVWRDLLNVEAVGPLDDFFELGGHSLLAMQAVSRMSTRLGFDVQLRDLIEHRRLGELADAVDRLIWRSRAAAPSAQAGAREEVEL
jgi:amino acid adenylation domain-containing protein